MNAEQRLVLNQPKAMVFLLLPALVALAFPACQSGSQPSNRITLAVVSGVESAALPQAAKAYEAQTGIKVEIAEFPYANLFEKELLDLTSNTGAYDLVMLDDPWFPRFASAQGLTDLTPLFQKQGKAGADEDFVAASLALCRHPYESGALYGLPYVGNSQLFFYRQDLFDKHRLKQPESWQEVLQAARTIHEAESEGAPGGGQLHGYVMRAAQGNAVVADFLPIFWAFGAEMFDAEGKPTVNSAAGIEALKFMLELGRYAPRGYVSFGANEVSAHLLQGTAAMSINWPAWISAFNDETRFKAKGKMAFAAMPSARQPGRAEIGNWLMAIPKGSKNAEAAFDFLLWVTSAEEMKKSALLGNPPTRKSLFTDAELLAKYPAYPVQLASLESSRPRPRTPLWNEIENAFGIFLSKANSGELTPEEAMHQANAELAKIVARSQ